MIKDVNNMVFITSELILIDSGAGINNAISTSKIKNNTAIKKNFRENPFRAFLLGLNPHSNGEFFWYSPWFFIKINEEISGNIIIIIKLIDKYINIIFSYYFLIGN